MLNVTLLILQRFRLDYATDGSVIKVYPDGSTSTLIAKPQISEIATDKPITRRTGK